MLYFAEGSQTTALTDARCGELVDSLIAQLERSRPLRRVLLIPPDYTRAHSGAGLLTCQMYERLANRAEVAVLPALGTHFSISDAQRGAMFPGIPASAFLVHDWRDGVETLGEVPSSVLADLSEGKVNLPAKVQVSQHLTRTAWDAIISVGQLVPHEVIGIANHVKNILIGVGGPDLIHKSHWLGAVYGMERIMGRARTPVRALLDHAAGKFLGKLPIVYLLTVRSRPGDEFVTNGLFAGDDNECFDVGAELCRAVNLNVVERAPRTMVVHLDPDEFTSTWLGNKAIYRTRMAIADGGTLIVLAPGVLTFGEKPEIDAHIRKFGYRGTPAILEAVAQHPDLLANLSAAAHLIHGSSEGRFRIVYCPGHLSRQEIESVGFDYGDLAEMEAIYKPATLSEGWNVVDGEEIYYLGHPASGLWGTRERFG
jgi:nickel-dependent lactate racemase